MVQDQYWKELYQLKTHIRYIELLMERSEKIDRTLKMILAIASSTSIGGWVIWRELFGLWATIIAASQVISAINPYLPYRSRIKEYTSLLHELEELMIQAEFKWYSIAEGELTASEINKARFDIRATKQKSLNKHILTTIPTDKNLHSKAEQSAKDYLTTFYPA